MNNDASIRPKALGLKHGQVLSVLVGILLATSNLAQAQTAAVATQGAMSREQVKMERDEFLKTHCYDSVTDNWVLKQEFEAPVGVKSRDQVKAERTEFLRNNHFDDNTSTWVPVKGSAVPASTLTRQQVRDETRQFCARTSGMRSSRLGKSPNLLPRKANLDSGCPSCVSHSAV